MLKIVVFIFFTFSFFSANAQLKVYDINQIDSLQIIEKRNVVLFTYTDWCKYCELMKHTTFKHKDLIYLLNTKYYMVMFNGESKQKVNYKGKSFGFMATGKNIGEHEFLKALTQGKSIYYPSIYVISIKNNIIFTHFGVINTIDLIKILNKLLL